MARPKGSKDNKKRKRKTLLNGKQERELIQLYNVGVGSKILREKYNISKAALSSLLCRRRVSTRVDPCEISRWSGVDNLQEMGENVCGVYGLCFVNVKNSNDIKIYVGSSTNIKKRLDDHNRHLKKGDHESKLLNEYYSNKDYEMKFYIVEKCEPDDVTSREKYYQHQYNKSCLLNSWISTKEEDLLPWLQKAITFKAYNNYTVNDNGCWESKSVHKSGYARLCVVAHKDWGPGEKKYLYSHRVAYWEKHGEYPELIRHSCNNPKCRNPDHLARGNYKDNALDKRGDFPETFEKVWVEFGGNVAKLSEYFGWKGNCRLSGKMVSTVVYGWEKKLGLRDKYPEILASRNNI